MLNFVVLHLREIAPKTSRNSLSPSVVLAVGESAVGFSRFPRFLRVSSGEPQECSAQARIDVFREIYNELNKVLMTRLARKLSRFEEARARLSKNRPRIQLTEETSNAPTRNSEHSKPPADCTTVSYPYIVYRLTPQQIDEDLLVIRKCIGTVDFILVNASALYAGLEGKLC